jgi:hypothetical protein
MPVEPRKHPDDERAHEQEQDPKVQEHLQKAEELRRGGRSDDDGE